MKVVEALQPLDLGCRRPWVFLAGGISGCSDWQKLLLQAVGPRLPKDVTVLNPRRANFEVSNRLLEDQIRWEYFGLESADLVSFWFAPETLNPITLFELGACLNKHIVVGCDPRYARVDDVVYQLALRRSSLRVEIGWLPFVDALVDTINRV
jgi:hypothetical protein